MTKLDVATLVVVFMLFFAWVLIAFRSGTPEQEIKNIIVSTGTPPDNIIVEKISDSVYKSSVPIQTIDGAFVKYWLVESKQFQCIIYPYNYDTKEIMYILPCTHDRRFVCERSK